MRRALLSSTGLSRLRKKQVAWRAHDTYLLKCSARQVEQRQGGRFNGFLTYYFGGTQCIQSYLKGRTFGKRMLPPLRDLPPRKPDEEVKRCTNRQNPRRAALARKHYFEGLVCDLNDPYSEQAKRRKTHRFVGMLQRMHDAREGTAFCP